jgi:hypothetical protein
MRSGFILAILMLAVLATGCSGLAANGTFATSIQQDASMMVASASGVNPDAVNALINNATRFDCDLATATRNPFTHTFGGKHIRASAPFYACLESVTAWSDEVAGRALFLSPANQQLALKVEAVWASNLRNGVNAAPGTSQLASLARLKYQLAAPQMFKARAMQSLKASTQPATSIDLITQLVNAVPTVYKPWMVQYGPVLIRIEVGNLDALISQLVNGDPLPIYRATLAAMTEDELMAEGANITDALVATVTDNAAKVLAQKQAAMAALSLGLTLLFSFIGL